jgi:hypothetical protein
MKRELMVLIVAVMLSGRAEAAVRRCADTDTILKCFNKVKEWKEAPSSHVQEATATTNTGVNGLVTPTQSTTRDFLSMLVAAFAVPMSGSGSRPVSLAYNVPFPVLGNDDRPLQLQAVFAKPEMSGDVKERLGSNAAGLTAVEDSLSEFDDLRVSASFSPSTRRLGRSFTPKRRAEYEAMLLQYLTNADAMQTVLADVGGPDAALNSTADPSAAEAAIGAAAEKTMKRFAEQYANLLNNQPQFYGSATYRARKNVAGPDERSASLTYEMGFDNLNTCEPKCAEEMMKRMATRADVAPSPENRVALAVEYQMWDRLSVQLPDYHVNFTAPKAHSLVYSMAYGRNHMMMENGRLDLSVKYEDTTARTATDVVPGARFDATTALVATNQPVRDRFVASATYTYKMTNKMAMPLTLTYANHAAFLGDVGRKLTAHFGLTFKMNP